MSANTSEARERLLSSIADADEFTGKYSITQPVEVWREVRGLLALPVVGREEIARAVKRWVETDLIALYLDEDDLVSEVLALLSSNGKEDEPRCVNAHDRCFEMMGNCPLCEAPSPDPSHTADASGKYYETSAAPGVSDHTAGVGVDALQELVRAAKRYVECANDANLSVYIKENGRSGVSSPWAELCDAIAPAEQALSTQTQVEGRGPGFLGHLIQFKDGSPPRFVPAGEEVGVPAAGWGMVKPVYEGPSDHERSRASETERRLREAGGLLLAALAEERLMIGPGAATAMVNLRTTLADTLKIDVEG